MLHATVTDQNHSARSNGTLSPRRADSHPIVALSMGHRSLAGAVWAAERQESPAFADAQATYGNQAVLRMLLGSSTDFAGHKSLQREKDCACGGSCGDCSGKN